MKRYLLLLLWWLPFMGEGQIITTVAGGGTNNNDSIQATIANIGYSASGVFDKFGNFYIATRLQHKIKKVTPAGIVKTVAGNGSQGFVGDGGIATIARLAHPVGVAVDTNGNIFIADRENARIRKVDMATNIITTYAGNGNRSATGDNGPAISASFVPENICIDRYNNIYIADSNQRIRKIDPAGMITTVVGNGTIGYNGDGGQATLAELTLTYSLATDTTGNIYLGSDGRVRKVDIATGVISTVAGTAGTNYVYNGDEILATNAQLYAFGICVDRSGNLFIADLNNHRVRKVDVTDTIHTIAGTGVQGFSGDGGLGTLAQLYQPESVFTDSCDNVYIADLQNKRIRKVTFNTNCTPTSIPTLATPLSFTLYPNPATSEITITSNTRLKDIHILNTLGQVVTMISAADKKAVINIGSLPVGIYYVRITDENGQVRTEKIIKEQCDNCNPSLQRMMEEPE